MCDKKSFDAQMFDDQREIEIKNDVIERLVTFPPFWVLGTLRFKVEVVNKSTSKLYFDAGQPKMSVQSAMIVCKNGAERVSAKYGDSFQFGSNFDFLKASETSDYYVRLENKLREDCEFHGGGSVKVQVRSSTSDEPIDPAACFVVEPGASYTTSANLDERYDIRFKFDLLSRIVVFTIILFALYSRDIIKWISSLIDSARLNRD